MNMNQSSKPAPVALNPFVRGELSRLPAEQQAAITDALAEGASEREQLASALGGIRLPKGVSTAFGVLPTNRNL